MTEAIQTAPSLLPADYEKTLIDGLREKIQPHLDEKKGLYIATATLAESLGVADAATLALADNLLKSMQLELAGLEAVRESGPGAFGRIAFNLNADFRTLRKPLETAIENLKKKVGAYVLAQRATQTQNYLAAAVAHAAGDHGDAQQKLALAGEAATRAPQGTTVKEVWEVAAYSPGAMVVGTKEKPGLVPDEKGIEAYARAFPIHEQPCLQGVLFRKAAAVTSRSKK